MPFFSLILSSFINNSSTARAPQSCQGGGAEISSCLLAISLKVFRVEIETAIDGSRASDPSICRLDV